ncbi:MAG: L-serine ammonia-lyase, iron-sulfur-dependent subunit beta [Treponema sp.]|jgi:L-serine dehydratase|nr:L-serine ammonia-lyase, iron-sulfur-dependent subunit beta [Treponema sp.]
MPKENVSVLEIFGPVIIGPSSSHTAGVGRIAFLTRKMFGSVPGRVIVRFYGSLASTWKGHGSGNAVAAGLLGIPPEDERLFQGMALLRDIQAQGEGFPVEVVPVFDAPPSWHPNTVVLELFGRQGGPQKRLTIRASSIGGGSIRLDEINGYQVNLSGELEAVLVLHHDEIGVIADVSHILAAGRINIAATSSHRKEKGEEALLVVETDGAIPYPLVQQIQALPQVNTLIRVPSLEGI